MARLRPDELLPSEYERRLARRQASTPGEGAAWGGGAGTAVGAGLGALLSIPSFGTLAPFLIPAGASVGAALGGAAGTAVGNAQSEDAERQLTPLAEARQRKLTREEMRRRALAALINHDDGI